MIGMDFETVSEIDITKSNAWTYSEHPSTEVICLAWKIDDSPTEAGVNYPYSTFGSEGRFKTMRHPPGHIAYGIRNNALFEAFNVPFEFSVWHNVMVKRHGWPEIAIERWRDPQAVAAYLALPLSLDALASALGFEGKDPQGKRLITKYSKLHLPTAKRYIPPEDVIAFTEYCIKDEDIEYNVSQWLGELPNDELRIWQHDLRTNLRGLYLDIPGIHDAIAIVEARSAELSDQFFELTELRPGQHAKVKQWLYDHGHELDDMQGETVKKFLEADDIRDVVREALGYRASFNKASTKKLASMLRNAASDGRARFQYRYHGTITGRNSGSGFQPLNLTRNDDRIPPGMLIRDIGYRNAKYLDAIYGDAMDAVSKSMRHYITAAPGKRLIVGDYTSIEAIVLAVLAGEQWKIDAFHNKEKIYERTADKIYKLPPGTVNKKDHPDKRQDGKVCELMAGYQGSVGGWRKFDSSDRHSDDEVRAIVYAWRDEHPYTVDFWGDLEGAGMRVIQGGDEEQVGEHLLMGMEGGFMYMEAPDNKRMWYPEPYLAMAMPGWHNPTDDEECAAGVCECKPNLQIHYKAWQEGQWRVVRTYGGHLAENACQFIARQLLMPAYLRALDHDYFVTLTVYDELMAEMEYGHGSAKELKELMEVPPKWAHDWPINAECWEGERYRK